MWRVLITLGLLILTSLGGTVMAQEDPAAQDPCSQLTNAPDSPIDSSLYSSLEHSALQMVYAGANDEALTLLTRIIDENPDATAVYALRGCLQARMGNDDEAVADWESFLDLSNDASQDAEVRRLIDIYSGEDDNLRCYAGGGIYADQREARGVIDAYNPSTAKGDDHNNRGLAYLCLGYYELAIRDFARALDTNKNSSVYYNNRGLAYALLGDHERAVKDFTKSLELEPDDPITFTNRAEAYINLEEYGDALVDLSAALEFDPEYEIALSKRANLYRLISDPENAIDDYTDLIEISPEAYSYNNRGLAYLDLGMYEEARDDFIEATNLVPDSAIYWYNLGTTYFSLDDMENALDAFNHSVELDPNDPEALDWRALIYYYIDENGLCIEDYTVLFTMDSPLKEKPGNWWRRGTCYHVLGNIEQAVRDYDHALELNPEYAVALAYRGVAYHTLDRLDDALDDLTLSIELDDSDAFAWRERGLVFYDMEQYENAIDDYDEALDLVPDHAITYFNRAYAYYHLKEYRRATRDFERYLELAPEGARREEVEELIAEMATGDL